VTGFGEHLNGLLNGKFPVLGLGNKRDGRMIRPAPFVEPGRRLWNEPRSDIPPGFLVARKFPYGVDHEFRIDAGLDQRTELPLGRFARIRPGPGWIRLPKFLELFARSRSGRVSDRPRESFILDSGVLALFPGISGKLTPPTENVDDSAAGSARALRPTTNILNS